MNRTQIIKRNFDQLACEIRKHAKRPIDLVAVTKYSPIEDIKIAYELGYRDFGENRLSSLETKAQLFEKLGLNEVRWHFIGNLQTNKIAKLVSIKNLVAIHSVDSKKLLEQLIKKGDHLAGGHLDLYFQVNTSAEDEKSGLSSYESLLECVGLVSSVTYSKFLVRGLMTMGKIRTDDFEKDAHLCFSKLSSYREKLDKDLGLSGLKLSMGMSRDFTIALDHGADVLRVGSVLFN